MAFDFSQPRWQADCRELSNDEKDAFLLALEKAFPDLLWVSGCKPYEATFHRRKMLFKGDRVEDRISSGFDENVDKEHPIAIATASDVREFTAATNNPAATVSEIDATTRHTGNKYHRKIRDIKGRQCMVFDQDRQEYAPAFVDFYSIERACALPGGGITHCAKKVLFCGIRGKGDSLQDLIEARDALTREIESIKTERAEGSCKRD